MAEFIRNDYNSRLEDAGLDTVILSLVNPKITSQALATAVSLAIGEDISADAVDLYIADRWEAGKLSQIEHVGQMPGGVERYDAPTGMGTDGTTIWFGPPMSGIEVVRWYVNSALKISRVQDLSSNRSASVAEIGAISGDVVQVAIESGGVVGWWGRIAIP